MASEKGLLKGKTVAVDATTLEANAAMKSIVRRDTGEGWQAYLKGLMLEAGEIDVEIEEVVADKGYHTNEVLTDLEFTEGLRTYIAEPKQTSRRNWKNKPDEQQQAFRNNHRRVKGDRGRALQRKRSERVERSFAHVCGSGGSRRAWLHGLEKVKKRHLMSAMTRNLGLVMRKLFGFGTAKSLQGQLGLADNSHIALAAIWAALTRWCASKKTRPPKKAPSTTRILRARNG